jgi:hypothetical protein
MFPLLLALILGPEHQTQTWTHRSPTFHVAAPAVALARDAEGAALAWSMPNAGGAARIHVARLDRFGQIGTIRELPLVLSLDTTVALYPSLSRRVGADGFLVTWIEQLGHERRAAYSLLDATLAPATPVHLADAGASPVVAATGQVMWITAGAQFWHIETNGFARGPFNAVWPASDMTETAGAPRLVSAGRDPYDFTCRNEPGCRAAGGPFNGHCYDHCRIWTSHWLRLVVPYDVIEANRFEFTSEAQPAVESDGEKLVMAWFRGTQTAGGEVVAAVIEPLTPAAYRSLVQAPLVLGRFGPDSGITRPDIAVTERGTYVVWRTTSPGRGHDVAGAFLGRDGTVEPFMVAGSAADESDPSILVLGNGSALVAYRKIEGGQSTIAWRTIGTAATGRRRAVR